MSSAPSSPFTASSSSASVSVKNTTLPVTHRMKFILVGDPAVGKSSFRECLRDTPTDIANMTPTIGCDFCLLHYVNTDLRQHVEVFLWDVAGNSRAGSITNDYLRDASGVICIFDLTRRETLYSIKDDWLPRVIEKNIHVIDEQESHLEAKHGAALNTLPDHAVQHALEFAMIGNKRDLESERKISTEEAVQLITQQWHIPYIELSCVADQKDKSMFFDPISCLVKLLMSNPYIERRSRQVVVDRERTRAQQVTRRGSSNGHNTHGAICIFFWCWLTLIFSLHAVC
jgi:GTPase SAR1 family protein